MHSVYKANLTQVWRSAKEDTDISLYVKGSSVTQCQARTSALLRGRLQVFEHGAMLIASE